MSDTNRKKAKPDAAFDLESLIETQAINSDAAALVREATDRIAQRIHRHKLAWLGHAYDVYRVQTTIAPGHFEAWVKAKTPFGRTKAYAYACAARMLLEYEASGGPKFGALPPMNSTIVCELASDDVPHDVRNAFLRRLTAGEDVKRAELDEALGRKPAQSEKAEPICEAEPIPMREPTTEVMSFVRGLRRPEQTLIRQLAKQGSLDMLIRALDALEFESISRPTLSDATADHLADRAAEAIRETPGVALPTPAPSEDDDDEDSPPTKH